jgi:hypothetical protein
MDSKYPTYYISIDELMIVFMALPANPNHKLRFITSPISLRSESGQLSNYLLQFDWNDSCQDWELSQGQPIAITARYHAPSSCENLSPTIVR